MDDTWRLKCCYAGYEHIAEVSSLLQHIVCGMGGCSGKCPGFAENRFTFLILVAKMCEYDT